MIKKSRNHSIKIELIIGPELTDALDEVVHRAVKAVLAGQRRAAPVAAPAAPKPEPDPEAVPRTMLTIEQLLAVVPIGYSTLKRMIRRKEFPGPSYISPNKLIWYADEIELWQGNLPKTSSVKREKRKRDKGGQLR